MVCVPVRLTGKIPLKKRTAPIPKERKEEVVNFIRKCALARKSDRIIAKELALIGIYTTTNNVCWIRRANGIPAGGEIPIQALAARWGANVGKR